MFIHLLWLKIYQTTGFIVIQLFIYRMPRNLAFILIILTIWLSQPCLNMTIYDRLVSTDSNKSQLQPGDYLTSFIGTNRILFNRDFTYTTMVYSNITMDFDIIMTFSLFSLAKLSRNSLKDQSEILSTVFVNSSGLYLMSNRNNTYDLTGNLRQSINFTSDFTALLCTEDLSLQMYIGNIEQNMYYPSMTPLVSLGQQFAYGFCPTTSRLALYGYQFEGRYVLTNNDQHFSMLMNFD
jgi:hypothetical protein